MSFVSNVKNKISILWTLGLEKRVNIFSVVVFLAHKVSYSCSPLVESIVGLESRQLTRRTPSDCAVPVTESNELDKYKGRASLWNHLRRPVELMTLIKRYHDTGNVFFIMAFTQLLCLAYLGFKSIFQAAIIGQDQQRAQYYASSWFPRLCESYPNPENFYALSIVICVYYFLLRLLCLRRLVLGSIINSQNYRQMTITQTNFPIAGVYNMPVTSWIRFVKKTLTHKRLCDSNEQVRKLHLTFDESCKDKLLQLTKKQLTYYTNAIDFNACFGEFVKQLDSKHRSQWSTNWHIAQSACRLDLHELGILILLMIAGCVALCSIIPVLLVANLSYEVTRLLPDPDEASLIDIVQTTPYFLIDFNALIKFLDVTLIILVQIPNQIEAGILYWDLAVMISRTRKVREVLAEDLKICRNKVAQQSNQIPDKTSSHQESAQNNQSSCRYCYANLEQSRKLNESIEIHLKMAQMLKIEFIDLKHTHTLYLNLLFVGCGFCISLCISLIFVVKSNLMVFILASLVISCTVPLIGVVLFCVTAELMVLRINQFRKLHRTMNRLLINEGSYINYKVIRLIMTVSDQFERTNDRSFQIAGQYPITPGTLGPYMAYISTCIVLVSKFF